MTYINTPFNYTGSKYKLLNQIIHKFDYEKDIFVDVFCGGGSVYTNVLDKYEKVLVNDIIEDLIGIHKNLLENDDIIHETKLISITKENQEKFIELRTSYNENKNPAKLWALMLGCTSNLMRFNQKGFFNQTWGKRQWNSSTENKVKVFTNHIRNYKDKITYISSEFYKIKLKQPGMFYIDPPYGRIKNSDDSMSNKQISEAGYNCFWLSEHDKKLYEYIHELNNNGHSFMVSGVLEHKGETSWMLDKLIQDGFRYENLEFNYGKVAKRENKSGTKEIIIMNY